MNQLGTITLSSCLIIFLSGCSGKANLESTASAAPGQEVKAETRQVSVLKVAPSNHRSLIQAAGTALPVRESFLSVPMTGTIQDILVRRGDRVEKGQTLLRLDRSMFALGVQQAEAGLAAAKVGLTSLETEKKRFDRLLASKAVPRASYDKVKAQYDGAAAQVALAEVGLKQAHKAYRDTELRAPYAGVITMVLKEVGEYAPAMPPTMLMKLVDTSSLEVQVFLPETESAHAKVGDQGQVRIDSANVVRTGQVVFVSDRIEPGTQTFEVRLKLDNADGAIKAGAFSRVELTRGQSDKALMVPLRAVTRAEGKTYLFLVNRGKAVRSMVRLGETSGDRILVVEGLQAGAEVITSGVAELKDGEAVEPLPGSAEAG